MATLAGMLTQTPSGNPQWRACDGKFVFGYQAPFPPQGARPHTAPSTGTYRDYWRNVRGFARTRGIGGWLIGAPYDPTGTWYVSFGDDSSDATLTNPPTVQKPPAGVK
jgi:hypothetical protein